MSGLHAWVLYEDRQGDEGGFRFHDLVLQVACDLMNGALEHRDMARMVQGNTRKGKERVLQTIRSDLENFAGLPVVAVLDADRIHELSRLPKSSCVRPHCDALLRSCGAPANLAVVGLRKNLETVLEGIRDIEPALVPAEIYRRAIEQHKRDARDIIFGSVARPTDQARAIREKLIARARDVAYLAGRLVRIVQAPGQPSAIP